MIETPFFASVRALHLLLVPILLACASARAAAPPIYTLTRVDPPGDVDFDFPMSLMGINDQGHVTSSWEFNYGGCRPVLHTGMFDSRSLTMIGGIQADGGDATSADAINASGQVAGFSALTTNFDNTCGLTTASGPYHAFRSDPNGGALHDLGTLGGDYSRGLGINTFGQVVGWSQLAGNTVVHGFVSGANNNVLSDIGTLGGTNSVATGVNDSDTVVGWSQVSGNSAQRAFFKAAGAPLRDLGTLGGTNSYATGINASGNVVGVSQISGNNGWHIFVSDSNGGTLHDIGVAVGGPPFAGEDTSIYLYGFVRINDKGQIVGGSFLYTPGIGVQNISDLYDHSLSPVFISTAFIPTADAINDLGEITGGIGSHPWTTYVISPVPRLEIEKAVMSAHSGATPTVSSDAKASAGAYTNFGASAGQYLTYAVPVANPGTYRVKVGVKTGSTLGKFQLSINGTNQGAVQDEYASNVTYPRRDLGQITFLAGGSKSFKFSDTGRNASSTGSNLALDYIELVPTARFETEELPVKGITPVPPGYTSFQWYGVFANSGASRGAGTYFNATGPGQFVTYTVKVAKPGSYGVRVGIQGKPNKGIFQLVINGVDVGQPVDEYSSNSGFYQSEIVGFSYYLYLGSGSQGFKFTVTGKNAASSGYTLAFDYIDIVPVQ